MQISRRKALASVSGKRVFWVFRRGLVDAVFVVGSVAVVVIVGGVGDAFGFRFDAAAATTAAVCI